MSDPVRWERDGAVVTVTIDRPDTRNAISDPEVVDALVAAFERLDRDTSCRVAILTGAGSAFSSGGNVRTMAPGAGGLADRDPVGTRRNYRTGIQRIPLLMDALEVPVIAAVNGPAIGAGLDLACLCDIRIAAEGARFAESFVKLGLIPGDGGSWLLPRAVGFSKAAEMTFTGEAIDAAEALRCGLVSQVVPDGELMAAARALAARIAANPGHALRMAKRLLREGQAASLRSVLETAAAMQALAHATADHAEAVQAFTDKREPNFDPR